MSEELEVIESSLWSAETEGFITEGQRDQAWEWVQKLQAENERLLAALHLALKSIGFTDTTD